MTLLAVSKTFPVDAVVAAAAAGQQCFGENYVQEAVAKIEALGRLGLDWHFIGPLQSNKTRPVAEHCHWVHSVSRLKIAERLSDQRPANLPPLQVCVQVNLGDEATKDGCAPGEAAALCRQVAALPRLRLRGLMAIPEPDPSPDRQRQRFAQLRQLRDTINRECGLAMDTLSMGMSADMEAAIAEGATIVRVGTAIFGGRT